MRFDPVARLKLRWDDIHYKRGFSDADMVDVFRLTRLILERGKLKQQYPSLAFYSDWLVHEALDRNPRVWEMIDEIDSAISEHPTLSLEASIIRIGGTFKLAELRQEFIQLFCVNGLETRLFRSRLDWGSFLSLLLGDLAGKPILCIDEPSLNEKRVRPIFERIVRRRMAHSPESVAKRVEAVYLLDWRTKVDDPERSPGIYWETHAMHKNGVSFMRLNGQLHWEDPFAFDFP